MLNFKEQARSSWESFGKFLGFGLGLMIFCTIVLFLFTRKWEVLFLGKPLSLLAMLGIIFGLYCVYSFLRWVIKSLSAQSAGPTRSTGSAGGKA